MTHRVGPKGQVVIPKPLRDKLRLRTGDGVDFWWVDDHVELRRAHHERPLRGRLADDRGLTDALLEARAADRMTEDAR